MGGPKIAPSTSRTATAAAISPGVAVTAEVGIVMGLPATVSGRVSEETSEAEPVLPPEVLSVLSSDGLPDPEAPDEPDEPELPPLLPAVGTLAAPPVPVAHWVLPCLSQAWGCGAVVASLLEPSDENVGLLHFAMLTVVGSPPGIFST